MQPIEDRTEVLRSLAAEADNIARRVCPPPRASKEFRDVFEKILIGLALNEYNARCAPWLKEISSIMSMVLPKAYLMPDGSMERFDDGLNPEERKRIDECKQQMDNIMVDVFGRRS